MSTKILEWIAKTILSPILCVVFFYIQGFKFAELEILLFILLFSIYWGLYEIWHTLKQLEALRK